MANPHGNMLDVLVIDGAHAPAYDADVDFDGACETPNREAFEVGEGEGVLVEIGGCGVADVYESGGSFVIPETYLDDEGEDAPAQRERTIATHPTTDPVLLGTVRVDSGVLVLMGLLGEPLVVPRVTEDAPVGQLEVGVAIAVEAGTYEVWAESFAEEPQGPWGMMPSRVRVVARGTSVVPGEPIASWPDDEG